MENSNSATTRQQQPSLPPGFRFHPTDEELVVHYLKKKATSAPLPVAIIAEVDLYKYDPWELPEKATYGEQEWYFFSPRDRKYPNGARPNRAATSGYWKATGTDKPVIASSEGNRKVGVKKALVFYGGKPPKGIKTNWIMHEYRLADNKACGNSKPPGFNLGNKKNSLRLDDWVLCRIYEKRISNKPVDVDHEREDCIDYMAGPIPPSIRINGHPQKTLRLQLPMAAAASAATGFSALLENDLSLHQRMISHHGQNSTPYSELASSSTTKPNLPSLPMKRTLEPYPSWDEEYHPAADPPSSKRLQLTDSSDNSITTLLGQLPPLQQQTIQGCIGDGLFRPAYQLPETNWYS